MARCVPNALAEQPCRFREHYYETTDRMEAVRAPGYFVPASRRLAAGDVIRVRAGLPDALAYEAFLVESVGDGAVRLRPLTAPARPGPQADAPPQADRTPPRQHEGQHHRHGQGGRR